MDGGRLKTVLGKICFQTIFKEKRDINLVWRGISV